jgi:hypothetical protein
VFAGHPRIVHHDRAQWVTADPQGLVGQGHPALAATARDADE